MYLGEELYEQLGHHKGIPLGKHDALYHPLMDKYKAMITTFRAQAEEHKIKVG